VKCPLWPLLRLSEAGHRERRGPARRSHYCLKRQRRRTVAFIPDPAEKATGTSAAEGVAVDAKGNIYGAEVGPQDVKKYVKK
jgi:hypothetical protein